MYLIRRTYKTKPYEAVNVAKLVKEQADLYTSLGQRSETRVEWTAEIFDNPTREGNEIPKEIYELGSKYRPLLDNSNGPTNWIEFWTILD